MNDRIRQLMIQAICEIDDCGDPNDKALQKDLKKMYIPNAFSERFTELVVQDCLNIIAGYRVEPDENDQLPSTEIRNHFGL